MVNNHNNILHNRSFILALAFFIGIALEVVLKIEILYLLFLIGIASIFTLIFLKKAIFFILILFLTALVGAFFVNIHRVEHITGRIKAVGTVVYTSRGTVVLKSVEIFRNRWESTYGKCRIYIGKRIKINVNIGDSVYIDGTATSSNIPGDICAVNVYETRQIGNLPSDNRIFGVFFLKINELRGHFISEFKRLIPHYSFLASSILLGDRMEIPENVYSVIRRSGFIHVFAISGMHVMIFAAIIFATLSFLGIPRNERYITMIASILFFIFLTGFSIPTIRAGFMAILMLLMRLLDRSVKAIDVIGAVALAFMLADPYIVFEASFQLTFIGTIALVLLTPIFYDWISRSIPHKLISEYLAVILAVNTGMIPIISYHFGVIYFGAIPLNATVVPMLLSILLEMGFVLIFLLFIHIPFLSTIFGYALDAFLNVFYYITYFTAHLPKGIVNIRMNIWAVMCIYITLLTLVYIYQEVK